MRNPVWCIVWNGWIHRRSSCSSNRKIIVTVLHNITCEKITWKIWKSWIIKLTLTTFWENLADNKSTNWWYFSYFTQKTGLDISCKLSQMETICMEYRILLSGENKNISKCCLLETICMKFQILFSGKNKKNISKCLLLKILPCAKG